MSDCQTTTENNVTAEPQAEMAAAVGDMSSPSDMAKGGEVTEGELNCVCNLQQLLLFVKCWGLKYFHCYYPKRWLRSSRQYSLMSSLFQMIMKMFLVFVWLLLCVRSNLM